MELTRKSAIKVAAALSLASIFPACQKKDHILADDHKGSQENRRFVVLTRNDASASSIHQCTDQWKTLKTIDLNYGGLGQFTDKITKQDHDFFIPVTGTPTSSGNCVLRFNTQALSGSLIQTDDLPVDVTCMRGYMYTLHNGPLVCIITKTSMATGHVEKKASLPGFPSRILSAPDRDSICVVSERLDKVQNICQSIFHLSQNLDIINIIHNTYSMSCSSVICFHGNLLLANKSDLTGNSAKTTAPHQMTIVNLDSKSSRILKIPHAPFQLMRWNNTLVVTGEAGNVTILGKDFEQVRSGYLGQNIYRSTVKNDTLCCLEIKNSAPLYSIAEFNLQNFQISGHYYPDVNNEYIVSHIA